MKLVFCEWCNHLMTAHVRISDREIRCRSVARSLKYCDCVLHIIRGAGRKIDITGNTSKHDTTRITHHADAL